MTRRRALMTRVESGGIDTSPRIAEYGKRLHHETEIIDDADCCYTVWYNFDTVISSDGSFSWDGYINTNLQSMWVSENISGSKYYYYTYKTFYPANTCKIRFTLPINGLDNCYAYNNTDGQIWFAGRNTLYYGYTNINDMPTGT